MSDFKIKVNTFFAWILGVAFIIAATGFVTVNLVSSLGFLISGILLLPPVKRWIFGQNSKLSSGRVTACALLLLLGTMVYTSSIEQVAQVSVEESESLLKVEKLINTESLAEKGDAEAQLELSDRYLRGTDVLQDNEKAFDWSLKAANQGLAEAQYRLSSMYFEGTGIPQDHKKAFDWNLKAANQGLVEAQSTFGIIYLEGVGVPQDHKKAFDWSLKAANQGDAESQNRLSSMYFDGVGVPQDHKKAFDWSLKAANQGLAEAQFRAGMYYGNGIGVAKDYDKATNWFRKSCDNGIEKGCEGYEVMSQ